VDGLDFIRHVRQTSAAPILVLSARSSEKDKVSALDLGANDYITKPFGTAELVARIRAALRTSRLGGPLGENSSGNFVLKDLQIDFDRRQVTAAGERIHLTQTEYNILALLARHTGKVLTYASVVREIWGVMDDGSVKKLQVNMANIRRKLGCTPGDNRYFTNELGVGYRMLDE
jgi:two-component system KDP operon response regulator KdpE